MLANTDNEPSTRLDDLMDTFRVLNLHLSTPESIAGWVAVLVWATPTSAKGDLGSRESRLVQNRVFCSAWVIPLLHG